MNSKLKKGITLVFAANLLNMIFSLITNFLLPKYLSVDSYSAIKTYQLYVTYIGVLHLGFVDGIYLKYGGKELDEIEDKKLMINLSTLRIFQFLMSIVFIIISILIKDKILLAFSFSIVSLNIASYYKMLYQAVGEFKKYSRITNLSTFLTFVVNMVLLFVFRTDNYFIYLLVYSLVNFVVWILLEYIFAKKSNSKMYLTVFSRSDFKENVKSGFSLMCGNFASFILTGLDRWCVKIFGDNFAFAKYSFAVSVENMLNVAITAITVPLYNFFCKKDSLLHIDFTYQCLVFFSLVLISSAFIIELILYYFIPNYFASYLIVFLLFAAQGFQIIIKSVYINLYKVKKMQNKYFYRLIIVIISGIVFNLVLYNFYNSEVSFAIGTLLSSTLWFVMSIFDFKDIVCCKKYNILLTFLIVIFLCCGLLLNPVIGFIVYLLFVFIFCYIFMEGFYSNVLNLIKRTIKK